MPESNSIDSYEYPCSSLQPHRHLFCLGEGAAENFCSNSFLAKPGCFENKPWCYTTDPRVGGKSALLRCAKSPGTISEVINIMFYILNHT